MLQLGHVSNTQWLPLSWAGAEQLVQGVQSCHGDSLGRAAHGLQVAKSRPVWTGVFLHTELSPVHLEQTGASDTAVFCLCLAELLALGFLGEECSSLRSPLVLCLPAVFLVGFPSTL